MPTARDDPYTAIARRHRPVCGRWPQRTVGVRMIITDNFRPATTCCAMRIDQGLWIDLEMMFGLGMDIGTRPHLRDPVAAS